MGGDHLRRVAVVDPALVEDVAQGVDVAGGEAVGRQGEVVRAAALGRRADHVVGHRVRVVDGRRRVERPGARDRPPGADRRRRGRRHLRRDEVEGAELVVVAPATPVGEGLVEGEDVGRLHRVAGHVRTVARRPYDEPVTTLEGEYEPSAWDWVRDQVAEYEASGGQRANTLLDTGHAHHRGDHPGRQERQGPQARAHAGGARRRVRARGLRGRCAEEPRVVQQPGGPSRRGHRSRTAPRRSR